MVKPKQTISKKSQVVKKNQPEVDRETLIEVEKQQKKFREVQSEIKASVSQCYKAFRELATLTKLNDASFQELVKNSAEPIENAAFKKLIKNAAFKELINNAAFTELIFHDLFKNIDESAIEELIKDCDTILDDCRSKSILNSITVEMLAHLKKFSVNDVMAWLIRSSPGIDTVDNSSGEDSANQKKSVALKQTATKGGKGRRKLGIVKDSEEDSDPKDSISAESGNSEEDESNFESTTEEDSEL
ncbi:MAG: hypothetical protein Q9210_002363 [Variospora velana]